MRVSVPLLMMMFTVVNWVMPGQANATRPSYNIDAGVKDPRYAALVLNPETGEVFHAHQADAKRYPASLTKMMTMYILFEEMAAGRLKESTQMLVSRHAASQPQTNIGLKAGERITVKDAIRALVVRSANDVAVVVAEHISGSIKAFASRATQTARKLGMERTVFKNPHGLPDAGQSTTARDMAKLGIALWRDFPKQYHYFSTEKFSWKGASYYTHNHVLTGVSGVDGIKTGYIRASGFNLVTSVKRGGKRLIGVVLGGYQAKWRDDRMKYLLNQGFVSFAARGNSHRIFANNLPLPREDKRTLQASEENKVVKPQNPKIVQASLVLPSNVPFRQLSHETLNEKVGQTTPNPQQWGIQVGAFTNKQQAYKAVHTAIKLAPNSLAKEKTKIVDAGLIGGRVHRARLENLSEQQAREACKSLIDKNAPCFVYKAGNQRL